MGSSLQQPGGGVAGKTGPELVRGLNVWHATSIVAGTIIGSGIFLVPAEMMQDVGSAGMVYLAWIVGGLLSFFGALTYAELGSVRPFAGGEYVYVRDAYGPLPGFLYGWTWFLIAKPASIASVTAGLVRVLGTFSAFRFLPLIFFHAVQRYRTSSVINYGQVWWRSWGNGGNHGAELCGNPQGVGNSSTCFTWC